MSDLQTSTKIVRDYVLSIIMSKKVLRGGLGKEPGYTKCKACGVSRGI